MAYGQKPPPEDPSPLEQGKRRTMKNQVLSRKARERSRMLRESSRDLIDASKELVTQSRRRKSKPGSPAHAGVADAGVEKPHRAQPELTSAQPEPTSEDD